MVRVRKLSTCSCTPPLALIGLVLQGLSLLGKPFSKVVGINAN
ncbi:MAG TPA: hypothetical protein VK553_04975 [Candidatus Nitrosopolaris rasttigaisensis]|nr:hypothetical protein [Candidatus Nitrosopolaris rasttigaisensis]